ncbi:MAG: HEAT repeat domain-containing protein [Myxococcota bacterium]
MTGVGPAGGAVERARRACLALSRAARAHRLYASNNATMQRMLAELDASFQELLAHSSRISLNVQRSAFDVEGTVVLTEEQLDDSLPFTFYRDGIRRLSFTQGLTKEELIGLLTATAQRFSFSGLGEDIVSLLWRLDLEHIDYVVVDTALADAASVPSGVETGGEGALLPANTRLAGVLTALFGPGEDAPLSVHIDKYDVPAKAIADALGRPDEMSPGLQPSTGLHVDATYAHDVMNEVAEEGDDAIAIRGLEGTLRALTEPLPPAQADVLGEAVLRMLDTAILENHYAVASRIVHGMRSTALPRDQISRWMDQVVAEARIRHVGARYAGKLPEDERAQVLAFFRACGGWAVAPILQLLPSIANGQSRRELSNLVLEFGIFDLNLIKNLLAYEQAFVAQEAVYMLSKLTAEGSFETLRELLQHPLPQVRASIAEHAASMTKDVGPELVADLLDDEDPRVRSVAARTLTCFPGKTTELLLASAAQKERLEGAPLDVKRATLESYALVAQERAVQPVARLVREGEGLFALRDQEELAIAGAWALARIRSVSAVEILKRTCGSRQRRVKRAAREALVWMRENA